MHFSARRKSNRLPKRFPVGTTYVVEGRGGEDGHLRVFCRYLVLPGGQRINLTEDFAGPASARTRGHGRRRGKSQAQGQGKQRSGRSKKIMAAAGTTRQYHR